jgi:hypothetical protein
MANNIVDFTTYWVTKKDSQESKEIQDIDDLHAITTELSNLVIDSLPDYDIDISGIEFSPEIVFFFEAFKALIYKCEGLWHPFQDKANEFFEEQGITIEKKDDGTYHYVIDDICPMNISEPAND